MKNRRPSIKKIQIKKSTSFDKKLFWITVFLIFVGVVAVADASAPQALNYFNDELYFAREQFFSAVIAVFALLLFSKINYKLWKKISLPLFAVSVLMLILVFIPGLGTKALGAKRWISLGGLNFQPSELVKLTLAMYLANVADSKKGFWSYLIPLGLVCLLIMFQPDLGTTLVIVAIGMAQVFVGGVNLLVFLGSGIFVLLSAFLLIITSSYRRQRLMTFMESTSDPLGKSYHIRQVLLALGSGGIFGVGLGASRQKFLFLPEAATDSIFAIIAEELGFIGGLSLVAVFVWFIVRGFRIVKNASDSYSRSLALGIVVWIASQAFLNIGSMVSLVPLTGLPLPFISYGGTSLVTISASVGILLNISSHART